MRNDTVFFYHYHTKQITDINYSLKFRFRIKPQPECVLNEHESGGLILDPVSNQISTKCAKFEIS